MSSAREIFSNPDGGIRPYLAMRLCSDTRRSFCRQVKVTKTTSLEALYMPGAVYAQ